uniref:Transcription initiation factor TFIID subunit 11 n=1 Tax=Blastobotrys adeninivorans TaxID=409370 RepID=A0A060SYF6_BLAAD
MGRKKLKDKNAAAKKQEPIPKQQPDEDEEMHDGAPPEEEEDEDDGVGGLFGINLAPLLNQNGSGPSQTQGEDDMEREKMKLLLSNFNEEQMSRYEAFRRANINRSAVKKLANAVLGQSITGNVAVGLSGMSKVFVGEIVEKARDVQLRMDHVDTIDDYETERPLRPEHLREAWRLYKLENRTVPRAHWRRQGGEGDGMMFR